MTRPLLSITTSYPQLEGDSAGHFVAHLNHAFAQEGWRVSTLAPHPPFQTDPSARSPLQPDRAHTYCPYGYTRYNFRPYGGILSASGAPDWIDNHRRGALFSAPLTTLSMSHRFSSVYRKLSIAEGRPPAVVSHWLLPSAWISREARPLAYCHGGDLALLETLPLKRSIARSIEENMSGLVFVSDDLRHRFQRVLGRGLRCPYWVLPMGVTAPRPCPDSRRAYKALVQDRFCIVTVGRLTAIKGYDLLAKALGNLSERARKEIYWLTAGDGPERSALELLAKKLEINQRSLGHLAPPQRDALLSIADLFVAPSRQIGARVEGSPVALREALTSGCSIIATRSGGVSQELTAFKSRLSPDLHGEVLSILPERVDQLKGALERFYTYWRATRPLEATSITRESLSKTQRSLTLSDEAKRRWLWTYLGPQHARALERSLL